MSSSQRGGGAQQLTTTVTKKTKVDQAALIAKILAALQPQISRQSIINVLITVSQSVKTDKQLTWLEFGTVSQF